MYPMNNSDITNMSVAMVSVQAYNESLKDVSSMIHNAFKNLTRIFK